MRGPDSAASPAQCLSITRLCGQSVVGTRPTQQGELLFLARESTRIPKSTASEAAVVHVNEFHS